MRVLCLHGWRTSGAILRQQMADLTATLTAACPSADLHFPSAPHPASGAAQGVVSQAWPDESYYEWWDKGEDGRYAGTDASLAFLREYDSRHGPFQAVVGFSQGGALAAVLCADRGVLPSLRFAVIVSGFCPADPGLKAAVEGAAPIGVRAVLTYGKRDFNNEASKALSALWGAGMATTVEHGAVRLPPPMPPLLPSNHPRCLGYRGI